jgi:signal transduction histidine kinase
MTSACPSSGSRRCRDGWRGDAHKSGVDEALLRLGVRDDGSGGADPVRGSGLVGLKDRVEALRGTITVHSPLGAGTSLDVELPLDT